MNTIQLTLQETWSPCGEDFFFSILWNILRLRLTAKAKAMGYLLSFICREDGGAFVLEGDELQLDHWIGDVFEVELLGLF